MSHQYPALAEDRLHLIGLDEALFDQLLLDLVQRLAAEVPQAEQLILLLGQQLADRRDVVSLQAVEGPDRKVELLDLNLVQAVADHLVAPGRSLVGLDVVAELDEELEMLRKQRGCAADGLLGAYRAIGPDLEVEPVVISRLTDPRLLHEEVGLHDRREDGVDRDHTDRLALVLVALGRDVALAPL